MIDHYFTSARGKFASTPITTSLNVLALSLGFACFIAALGVSRYWALSDAQFSASERIHIVTTNYGERDGEEQRSGFGLNTPVPVARYLKEDFPQLAAVARMMNQRDWSVKAGDRRVMLTGARADRDILKIFDFEFIAGDPATALDTPDSVLLTRSAAESLFGNADPIGQTVSFIDDSFPRVTAVIEDVQAPSHMADTPSEVSHFDFLYGGRIDTQDSEWWLGTAGRTYVLFPEDRDITPEALTAQFDAFLERRLPDSQRGSGEGLNIELGLVPLAGVQARALDVYLFGGNASGVLSVTSIIAALGFLVLIVACVNYSNLAAAQAANRSKEVGMRRALGAGSAEVLAQYWFEALLLTLLAALLTLALTWLAAPLVERATFVDLRASLFSDPRPLLIVAVMVGLVSFFASLYPVAILSRVRPVDAIRAGMTRTGPRLAMQVLIAAQFAIASGLLISLIVINAQNEHLRQKGLNQRSPIAFLTGDDVRRLGYTTLQQALANEPSVEAVSQMGYLPWSSYDNWLEGTQSPDGSGPVLDMFASYVGYDFFKVFDATLIAGRTFDPSRDGRPSDDAEAAEDPPSIFRVVVDRPVTEWMGYDRPELAVGQLFYLSESLRQAFGRSITYEIIGVVESMPLVFSTNGRPWHVYVHADEGAGRPVVRFAKGRLEEGMARLRQAVLDRQPDALLRLRFYDDAFEAGFRTFGAVNAAFLGLSLIAFAVSVIGLVAMAVFVAGRRRHEIGVRKTLGASTVEVTGLLLRDFTGPVLIGNLVAWPLAWWVARTYLGSFNQQVALTTWPWLSGLSVTLIVAWLAVGGQAWRAARVKPALVLRHE
ncbi:MAG: FtsX-like permease family protein [Myxococcota bacterium]